MGCCRSTLDFDCFSGLLVLSSEPIVGRSPDRAATWRATIGGDECSSGCLLLVRFERAIHSCVIRHPWTGSVFVRHRFKVRVSRLCVGRQGSRGKISSDSIRRHWNSYSRDAPFGLAHVTADLRRCSDKGGVAHYIRTCVKRFLAESRWSSWV